MVADRQIRWQSEAGFRAVSAVDLSPFLRPRDELRVGEELTVLRLDPYGDPLIRQPVHRHGGAVTRAEDDRGRQQPSPMRIPAVGQRLRRGVGRSDVDIQGAQHRRDRARPSRPGTAPANPRIRWRSRTRWPARRGPGETPTPIRAARSTPRRHPGRWERRPAADQSPGTPFVLPHHHGCGREARTPVAMTGRHSTLPGPRVVRASAQPGDTTGQSAQRSARADPQCRRGRVAHRRGQSLHTAQLSRYTRCTKTSSRGRGRFSAKNAQDVPQARGETSRFR